MVLFGPTLSEGTVKVNEILIEILCKTHFDQFDVCLVVSKYTSALKCPFHT